MKKADQFKEECEAYSNLILTVIPGHIKIGPQNMKKSHPSVKDVIVGTFLHHPYSFAPRDDVWPDYMHI